MPGRAVPPLHQGLGDARGRARANRRAGHGGTARHTSQGGKGGPGRIRRAHDPPGTPIPLLGQAGSLARGLDMYPNRHAGIRCGARRPEQLAGRDLRVRRGSDRPTRHRRTGGRCAHRSPGPCRGSQQHHRCPDSHCGTTHQTTHRKPPLPGKSCSLARVTADKPGSSTQPRGERCAETKEEPAPLRAKRGTQIRTPSTPHLQV